MKNLLLLTEETICYFADDPKRIQHFIKVHSFAKLIGEMESIDPATLEILEAASILHDIGIKTAEQKYGSCDGKLQEQEGPPIARKMLEPLEYDSRFIERVCYLVGHHHTYDYIAGIDHQILIEADFLVNIYEDGLSKGAALTAYNKVFKTSYGKFLCRKLYGLQE
ncbi:HD domain-containing protein [Anaerobium acetethylicum]|uniref:HD domain-containing protein n=1 Tax=Anaerobium acetethylicum TaxID=1619234 RepID=A0A1D3TSB3_9FIRM|nr:HD domain-containing protein [Anaerobium acetethylicum]SCP96717.1 HD domain-containing protein [Anaerobium acetethylicum]